MKYLLTFRLTLLFVGIFADDPICKETKWLRNPRECCLNPKLITIDIIEKCRARTSHMRNSQFYNDLIIESPAEEQNMHFEADQMEEELSSKPTSSGYVRNEIKRNTRSARRYDPFDFNEYGDSDEKISPHRTRLDKVSSEDSSESREHCNHHHHKHHHKRHHGRHHCRHRHHNEDYNYQFQQNRVPRLKKYSCIMDCVINETGIIENKTMNMAKVHNYLTEVLQLNDEYLPIVTEAFEICGKNVKEMRQKLKELPVMPLIPPFLLQHGYKYHINNSKKCKPWSGYLMMCIKAQMFINCPPENFNNDDIECSNTREIMKVCPQRSAHILFGL